MIYQLSVGFSNIKDQSQSMCRFLSKYTNQTIIISHHISFAHLHVYMYILNYLKCMTYSWLPHVISDTIQCCCSVRVVYIFHFPFQWLQTNISMGPDTAHSIEYQQPAVSLTTTIIFSNSHERQTTILYTKCPPSLILVAPTWHHWYYTIIMNRQIQYKSNWHKYGFVLKVSDCSGNCQGFGAIILSHNIS